MYTLQSGHQHGIAYDITGTPATNGAHPTDVHVPLRVRAPGMSQHDTTTVISVAFGGNRQSGALEAASALRAKGGTGHGDFESETFIIQAVQAERLQSGQSGKGDAAPLIAFQERGRAGGRNAETQEDLAYSLNNPGKGGRSNEMNIASAMSVRRLMPVECERLQGFPDNFTSVLYRGSIAADGPRYRALGNSMAVPCIAWILCRVREATDG